MGVAAEGQRIPEGDGMLEVIHRAADGYERWMQQLARTGYCAKPIRLVGRVTEVSHTTGEIATVYDTESEPDRNLLIACGDRRESRCPSCAATYRGDAFQLVSAGLRGGKGVPESVADHPSLFVTFTAPSFGPVHASRSTGGVGHPCCPRRSGKCAHGIPLSCWKRHDENDVYVGQPLCAKCFDYEGLVLWNALAPELWRRTTIYIRRELAKAVDMRMSEFQRSVRLSYLKVGEYQRRGALHFHAVIRLDGVCEDASHILPPPPEFSVELLEEAISCAAETVSAPLPSLQDTLFQVVARWGEQLHMKRIGGGATLSQTAVAAYVAKYATKCSDDLGFGDLGALEGDLQSDHHLARAVRAAKRLGQRRELQQLRLHDCAYALGFKGHWSTKSRRYSTTFTALRSARRRYARSNSPVSRSSIGLGVEEAKGEIETRSEWHYIGSGHRNHGEAWLALSAAARAREHRILAKEDLAIRHSSRREIDHES